MYQYYSNNISSIYRLVQCSPDLKELDCDNCLEEGFGSIQVNCYGRDFARYGNPSCNIRFEVDSLFFDPAEYPQNQHFSQLDLKCLAQEIRGRKSNYVLFYFLV